MEMAINYPKQYVKSDGRKLVSSGPRDMQRKQQVMSSVDSAHIEQLYKQIEDLKLELRRQQKTDGKSEGLYTAEEVDEEIRKAVKQAVAEAAIEFKKNKNLLNQDVEPVLQKYKMQIVELQKSNDDLTKMHRVVSSQNTDLKKKIDQLNGDLKSADDLKKQIAVLEQVIQGKEELIETLKSRPAIVDGEIITEPDRPQMENIFVDPLEKDAGEGMKDSINIEDVTPDDQENIDNKVDKLKDLLGSKLNRD
jgi:hypothetical protein